MPKLYQTDTLCFIKTFLTTCLVFVLFLSVQVFSVILVSFIVLGVDNIAQAIWFGSNNGQVVALSVIVNAVLMCGFCGFVASKFGNTKDIIGYRFFKTKTAIGGVICLLVMIAIQQIVTGYFDQSPMQFMDNLINGYAIFWLMFSVVIVAPIYEEIVFRGLIFGLLKNSFDDDKIGFWVAGLASSFLFTIVHFQYNLLILSLLFMMSMVWAYFRHISGSVFLTIGLHMLNNVLAMICYRLFGA